MERLKEQLFRNASKRVLALSLALLMIINMVPVLLAGVFAAEVVSGSDAAGVSAGDADSIAVASISDAAEVSAADVSASDVLAVETGKEDVTKAAVLYEGTSGGANWEIDDAGCLRIFKADGDGIMDGCWWSSHRDIIKSVVVEDGVSAGTSTGSLFYGLSNCTTMDLRGLDVSNVDYMGAMFQNCSSMEHYDITGWNTEKLTNTNWMFGGAKVADFPFEKLDTSDVWCYDNMFREAKDKSLDLSKLDTSGATLMQCVFYDCEAEYIDFSGWDTSNVTNFTQFFQQAHIKEVDLSSFDVSNVEQMINFMEDCDNLISFDTSGWNWDLSKNERFDNFLYSCDRLESADLSGFKNVGTAANISMFFSTCGKLKSVKLGDGFVFDGSVNTAYYAFFEACVSLEEIDISSWGTNINGNGRCNDLFEDCVSLKKIVAPNVSKWFNYCSNLSSVDTYVIGGKTVFDSQFTKDNVTDGNIPFGYRENIYWNNTDYVNDCSNPVTATGGPVNAFFTEIIDGDMYVYYLPKDGETTQKVTVEKDGVTTVVDLLEHPEYYVIEDVTDDTIITIKFGPTATVTFMDSTDDAELGKVLVPKGDAAPAPETPVHEGVEFLYWATEKNGETEADLTAVNEDMTVWAVYGIPSVEVTFKDSTDDSTIDTVSVEKGEDVTAPAAPAHDGLRFVRWATEKNGDIVADLTAVTEDMTVWAVYAEIAKFAVNVTSTGEGTAVPAGTTIVEEGEDVNVTITPKNDRISFTVTVNGKEVKSSELTADGDSSVLALTDIREDKDVVVTFTGTAITGAPSVVFEKSSKTFEVKENIKFKAIGFWADSKTSDFINGDERYVPLKWHHAEPSGDFGGKTAPTDTYSGSFKQTKAGTYTLKVEFQKYTYKDGAWAKGDVVTVSTEYKVTAPSGGTEVPDTGDHSRSAATALYVSQIVVLSTLLGIYGVKGLKRRNEQQEWF